MTMIDRRGVLLGGTSLLGAAALPASSRAQTAEPRRGGTLTVGFDDNARTMDPTFSIQFSERQVLFLIYNTLTTIGTDFSIQPELARSWTIENEGKRYVLRLQEGVKFHDGTDFNAAAVKYNFDRRLDERVNSPQRSVLRPVIDNVEVVAPHVVAINLRTPYPSLLADLADRAGLMVSPTAAERLGQDFGRNPVGTGAFTFRQWVQGTSITLERNANYWEQGRPYLDRVVFRTIPNQIIGMQRLIVGEVDYVDSLTPEHIRQVEGRDGIVVQQARVGRWYSLQWQVDKPPFNNPLLRRAIAHALDRDRINAITMGGRGTIANGPVPPGLWWSSPDSVVHNHDPARARQLLAEAGIAQGTEITLAAPSDPLLRQIVQLVSEQLGAVGLRVVLAPVAQSEYYARTVQRAINFTPMAWTQRADPDGLFFILFHSRGFANSTGYNSPDLDAALDAARATTDVEARRRLYARAKEIVVTDLPYVPLYFAAEYAAVSRRIQGWVWTPDQIPRFRYAWRAS